MRYSSEHDSTSSGNDFFLGLLTVAFIVLKLLGYINWSWWWVLAPIWIPFVVYVFLVIVFSLVKMIHFKWRKYKLKRDRKKTHDKD